MHLLDLDASIVYMGANIFLNPILGTVKILGKPLELIVGDAGHDLDASAGEEVDSPVVGVEELDLVNVVVLEYLDDDGRLQNLGGLGAPVYAEAMYRGGQENEGETGP